jgi:hypothetical protein
MWSKRTIEERIKVIIVYLAQFEEVFANLRACFNLEINDYVPKGGF